LIETVVIYRLPRLTREEIQTMLKIHDIRESRVYQEAKAEGVEEERARQLQERLSSVAHLAEMNMAPNRIADILKLDVDLVLQELAKNPS
jgi:predicted transposase YdaD